MNSWKATDSSVIEDYSPDEPSEANLKENESYFDFGSISKALIILGVIMLLACAFLYVISNIVTSEVSIWEDAFVGPRGAFLCAVPISMGLLVIGCILYLFHRQFVKLADIAKEVESGEFEKKALKELDDECDDEVS